MSTQSTTDTSGAANATAHPSRSFSEQSSRVLDEVKELGNVALGSAGHAVDEVRHRGHDALDSGRERVHDARDSFEDYVRRHPMKSVLVAAGVGAIVSRLARR